MTLAGRALRHPDTVHLVALGASVLAVPFLVDVVRRATGDRLAALLAGLLLATLPLPVAAAWTEHHLVLGAALQVLALAGVLRSDRRGDALAVAAIGLLAHTRPLQLAVAAVLVGALAVRGRRAAALLAGALVAGRGVQLAAFLAAGGDGDGLQLGRVSLPALARHAVGPDGHLVLLDPTRTPAAVGVLAVGGALLAVRRRGAAGWLAALLALGVGLYALQPLVPDRLRLQLPAQPWAAGLAGLALAEVGRRTPRALAPLVVAVVLSYGPALRPYGAGWAWQHEHAVLREVLPLVPAGATVHVGPPSPWSASLAAFAARRTGARWVIGGTVRPGDLRWVGLADHLGGGVPEELVPVRVGAVPSSWGGLVDAPPAGPLRVGLYRATADDRSSER